MLNHPHLFEIKDFHSVEEAQHFIKKSFNLVCFFPIARPTQYKTREAGTGMVLPFYMISFLNSLSEKRYRLYRIVDTRPESFNFEYHLNRGCETP